MNKKILSFFLTFIMVLSLFPAAVFATNGTEFVTSEVTYNGTASDDGYLVTLDGENVSLLMTNTYDPAVTINFVGRDGNPLSVDVGYSYGTEDTDGDGYVDLTQQDTFENVSALNLENPEDGWYDISIMNTYGNGYEVGGTLEFKVQNGVIVEEYDEDGDRTSPYTNTHFIHGFSSNSMTVEVASIMYDFSVSVMGIDVALPYEVKDESGNVVAWSYAGDAENSDSYSVHLDPGTYKLYSLVDETFEDVINFPKPEEYVEFEVNEDYTVTVNGDYNTYLEDYSGSGYWLTWYLDPKNTVDVTATINTADGTNFPENTTISLYLETGYDEETYESYYSTVDTITVPTDVSEFTYTWTVASQHSEIDEEGETQLVENIYEVRYTDFEYNEIVCVEQENNVWTATIPGSGKWSFEIMADAGYYSDTEDGENKVGVIALNAGIENIADMSFTIVKYGMCLYRNGELTEVTYTDDASDNVSQLEADNYRYHAIVKNIAEDDFYTVFQGLPYVIVEDADGNQSTLIGDVISASVIDYYRWLGSVNPYQE